MLIIAHRGANKDPENSLSAIRSAMKQGFSALEFDVRASSDGVLYLLHDKRLWRTTNKHGLISKKDSGFLKDCLLKNDEPLPKLDDALKLLENFKGTIFVESKMPEYEKKILFLIKKHSLANHSVFESFNFESLKRARMLDKKIRLLYTLWIPTRKSLKKAKSINCYALAPPAWSLRKRFVQSAKKEKIKIYAFDVKTKTLLKRVRSLDIDGIFADKYY